MRGMDAELKYKEDTHQNYSCKMDIFVDTYIHGYQLYMHEQIKTSKLLKKV